MAQRDQQHVENEHFGRFGAGYEMEPLAHQFLAENEDDREYDNGLEQGDAEQHCQFFRRLGQCRDDDQQRHDREVLEEQHAHDLAAMRRIELHAFAQQFGQHGGRRHGEDATQRDAQLPVDAEEHDQPGDQRHADGDLQNTSERIACRRFRLNSRPIENIRKTTPNSARYSKRCTSGIKLSACGPMTLPTAR